MHYTQYLLDELVSEGFAVCVVDEETGYSYYMAGKGYLIENFMYQEAIASVELDRDGTFSIG